MAIFVFSLVAQTVTSPGYTYKPPKRDFSCSVDEAIDMPNGKLSEKMGCNGEVQGGSLGEMKRADVGAGDRDTEAETDSMFDFGGNVLGMGIGLAAGDMGMGMDLDMAVVAKGEQGERQPTVKRRAREGGGVGGRKIGVYRNDLLSSSKNGNQMCGHNTHRIHLLFCLLSATCAGALFATFVSYAVNYCLYEIEIQIEIKKQF